LQYSRADIRCPIRQWKYPIFCRARSNIGSDSGGFEYRLIQTAPDDKPHVNATAVAWGSSIDGTAREILADAEAVESENGGGKSEAVAFIQDILLDGPKSVREIQSPAKANSIAWRTLERAKKDLGVKAVKSNFGALGAWEWHLPQRPPKAANESKQESVAAFGGLCGTTDRNIGGSVSSSLNDEGDA
jgi:putative DNA primase/helicase